MCVSVCVCLCMVSVTVKRPVLLPCVVDGHSRNPLYYLLLQGIQYYVYIYLFFRFYTFFCYLLKRSVLTLVGEIQRYRNGRCYYY